MLTEWKQARFREFLIVEVTATFRADFLRAARNSLAWRMLQRRGGLSGKWVCEVKDCGKLAGLPSWLQLTSWQIMDVPGFVKRSHLTFPSPTALQRAVKKGWRDFLLASITRVWPSNWPLGNNLYWKQWKSCFICKRASQSFLYPTMLNSAHCLFNWTSSSTKATLLKTCCRQQVWMPPVLSITITLKQIQQVCEGHLLSHIIIV